MDRRLIGEEAKSKVTCKSLQASFPRASPLLSQGKEKPKLIRRLEVEKKPPFYSDEIFQVYKKYQHHIHGDDKAKLSPEQFNRFLVLSQLIPEWNRQGEQEFGSVFQVYKLDGKVIAVGVCDILHDCLVS